MKGVYQHAVWKRTSQSKAPDINLFDDPGFNHHDTDAQCLRRKS
jgi:hypothetical protein